MGVPEIRVRNSNPWFESLLLPTNMANKHQPILVNWGKPDPFYS